MLYRRPAGPSSNEVEEEEPLLGERAPGDVRITRVQSDNRVPLAGLGTIITARLRLRPSKVRTKARLRLEIDHLNKLLGRLEGRHESDLVKHKGSSAGPRPAINSASQVTPDTTNVDQIGSVHHLRPKVEGLRTDIQDFLSAVNTGVFERRPFGQESRPHRSTPLKLSDHALYLKQVKDLRQSLIKELNELKS